ncbi:MAG: hypothetical protein ABI766_10395 [Gemmatimonadales bacterium]
MGAREAYLKREYAWWYPAIPAEEWIVAHTARHLVEFQLKYGEPRWECASRLLDPEHFRFRGGDPGGKSSATERRREIHSRPGRPSGGRAVTSDQDKS